MPGGGGTGVPSERGCWGTGVQRCKGEFSLASPLCSSAPLPPRSHAPRLPRSPAQFRRVIVHEAHHLVRPVPVLSQGLRDGAAGPARADDKRAPTERWLGQDHPVEPPARQECPDGKEGKGQQRGAGGRQSRSNVRDEQIRSSGDQAGLEDGLHGGGELPDHAGVVGIKGLGDEQPEEAQEEKPEGMPEHQGSIQPVSGPHGQRQEQRPVHGQQVQRHQDQPPLGEGKAVKVT